MEKGEAWRCRRCGQVLGVLIGQSLLLSLAVAVNRTVTVQCRACQQWQTWYPEPPGVRTAKDSVPLKSL